MKSGVLLHEVATDPSKNFGFDLSSYKHALAEARSQGKIVRSVLICNPHNPCGTIMTRQEMTQLVEWIQSEPELHLVMDEIYALSVFGHLLPKEEASSSPSSSSSSSSVPLLSSKSPFISISNLLPTLGDRIHAVWSISKDFGLSGFRCGLVLTENRAIQHAYRQLSQFNGLSTDVQHFVHLLLTNETRLIHFLSTMQHQLARCVEMMMSEWRQANVPFVQPDATLFMWIDLRKWLSTNDDEGELCLYNDLLQHCNVNLTPGTSFHGPHGWFRFVHAGASFQTIQVAVKRITTYLKTRTQRNGV